MATAASFAAGLLFLIPLAAGEAVVFGAPDLGARGWLVVAYLGAGASALPIFLWTYALRHVPASAAAHYTNLVPAVGLASALLAGETRGGGVARRLSHHRRRGGPHESGGPSRPRCGPGRP